MTLYVYEMEDSDGNKYNDIKREIAEVGLDDVEVNTEMRGGKKIIRVECEDEEQIFYLKVKFPELTEVSM